MKRTLKKCTAFLLAAIMIFGSAPLGFFVFKTQAADATYQNGDIIQYGTYPKSRITNSKLITKLDAVDKKWKDYSRYTKDGTRVDWYKYTDFFYES